jgi:signal transduction histidine kinase
VLIKTRGERQVHWQTYAVFAGDRSESLAPSRKRYHPQVEYVSAIIAVVLTAGIFVADTITKLEIAFPAFYTAVVLLSVRFCNKRGVVFVGAGCVGLTLLSDVLTQVTIPTEEGIINTGISLVAIASTTYLAINISSEKKAAYEIRSQLAHVMRVTTLGEMAASIAHEINQPLAATVINGNACLRWLEVDPPNLEEARHAVARLVKEATRAGEIIAQVRNLTQNTPSKKNWLGINEIIAATATLIDREIQQNTIFLEKCLSEDIPLVQGDRVQLQQVILNLLINAVESMTAVTAGSRRLTISSSKRENGVLIAVGDTGKGIARKDFDRLFNAFYTTKRNGMGMGLAISRSIVESHGGRIWATRNAPRGAIFQFLLPKSTEMIS